MGLFYREKEKIKLLTNLLKQFKQDRTIVFSRTKHGADKIVKLLAKNGLRAAAIHGNKSQNARQKALGEFKENRLKILIATDIAARGIDIEQLPMVINYDLPNVPETYVHRIGRTGRAG
ncbi:C-terminal helicase domain-containing protein [Sphingobacterium sp. E70]|uniref:helicase-related protein n=1 Tax=Sphingobacterium sp. E70 TaxID=2853439 RepID=UPI002795A79F|nr:C-terminal helicase domain-containing protein [Sphingobacterium sp. E70]